MYLWLYQSWYAALFCSLHMSERIPSSKQSFPCFFSPAYSNGVSPQGYTPTLYPSQWTFPGFREQLLYSL